MTNSDLVRDLRIELMAASDRLALLADKALSQADHVELALMFLDMADRVLKRMTDRPEVGKGDVP